jgi:hypothetical protein
MRAAGLVGLLLLAGCTAPVVERNEQVDPDRVAEAPGASEHPLTDPGLPPGSGPDRAHPGATTLNALHVPSRVEAGVPFQVHYRVEGRPGTSARHIDVHVGLVSSAHLGNSFHPDAWQYLWEAEDGGVWGSYEAPREVRINVTLPWNGTWFLRAHTGGTHWSEEGAIRAVPPREPNVRILSASPGVPVGENFTVDVMVNGPPGKAEARLLGQREGSADPVLLRAVQGDAPGAIPLDARLPRTGPWRLWVEVDVAGTTLRTDPVHHGAGNPIRPPRPEVVPAQGGSHVLLLAWETFTIEPRPEPFRLIVETGPHCGGVVFNYHPVELAWRLGPEEAAPEHILVRILDREAMRAHQIPYTGPGQVPLGLPGGTSQLPSAFTHPAGPPLAALRIEDGRVEVNGEPVAPGERRTLRVEHVLESGERSHRITEEVVLVHLGHVAPAFTRYEGPCA